MIADVSSQLREYYQHSPGYKTHLAAKEESYFSRYVAAVCGCSDPSDRILDLGCGTGQSSEEIAKRDRHVFGADLSTLFLNTHTQRRPGLSFVAADAAGLPFADGSLDVVSAMEFIEHVWPVDLVLSEMDRVLEPGGRIILFSPNLLSPLWFFKDLPRMVFRRKFRPPMYSTFGEAIRYLWNSCCATARKAFLTQAEFISRQPDLCQADFGGDFDAVYVSQPRDIILYLRNRGYSVRFARPTSSSTKDRLRMWLGFVFGSLWTSYILEARKG